MTDPKDARDAEALIRRIAEWSTDDKQGYDVAIGLLCEAGEALATLVDQLQEAQQDIALWRQWRVDVTAALQNPGGALYVEVPTLVRKLRERAEAAEAALALARQDRDAFRATLQSIADNSCCTPCREAGLVARAALSVATARIAHLEDGTR